MNFLTKNIKIISVCLFIIIALSAFLFLNKADTQKTLFAFDTFVSISFDGKKTAVADEIEAALLEMENQHSKFRSDSVVSKFNNLAEGEKTEIPPEMASLILRCDDISQKTDGAFDITTSTLSDLWQVKTATEPPSDANIKLALLKTGYEKISLDENTLLKTDAQIDFGGVLKGFAADKIREIAS
ncbi:MAG: FAD:protein FMN transferase, partial [Clostridia bacterium]|nr:FAD:protein FMN transferase [Clostridia bacterium]